MSTRKLVSYFQKGSASQDCEGANASCDTLGLQLPK